MWVLVNVSIKSFVFSESVDFNISSKVLIKSSRKVLTSAVLINDLSKKASEDFANYNLQQRLKKKENPSTSELLQTPIKKENPLTSELLQSGLKGLKKKPIEPLPTNKPLSLQEELQLKVKNPNLKKSTETVAAIKLPTLADEIAYQRANLRKVENGIEAPKSKKQTNESLPPLM